MENYVKAPAAPPAPETNKISDFSLIDTIQLDTSVLHMNVKTGSKVSNLLTFANNKFKNPEVKQITWNGTGEALNKVVACAEIMKKDFKWFYFMNKNYDVTIVDKPPIYKTVNILFHRNEEIWNSKLEILRDIKVTKQIPIMCIVLSKVPLDSNEPGYQTSDTISGIFNVANPKSNKNKSHRTPNVGEEVYIKKKKANKNK